MKMPKKFEMLVHNGLVDEVLCQLMSGKEADGLRRPLRRETPLRQGLQGRGQAQLPASSAQYQEGRKVRNSRQARAMEKDTRYRPEGAGGRLAERRGRRAHRLAAAGVRVPQIYSYFDGVLLMELVIDADGHAAPRLNDVELTADRRRDYHRFLIAQVVLMLCAGLVHGDLSEYNVLVGSDGPVIIDLPQAVDAAGNNNAAAMLERDVGNMTAYFGRFRARTAGHRLRQGDLEALRDGGAHPRRLILLAALSRAKARPTCAASCGKSTRPGVGMSAPS